MNSVAVALAVLGCTFAGGLAGLALHGRLPDHHREGDSKDVVKLVMGLIATVSALVLSLLISSSHRSYEAQQAEVQQMAVHIFQLDRALKRLGPEAEQGRRILRGIVQAEVDRADGRRILQTVETPLEAQRAAALLFEQVSSMKPADDMQRFVQGRVLQLIGQLGDTRLLLSEQARGSISWPFLVILTCWLTTLFLGFGLLAKRNLTIVVSLLVGAMCVSGAVFLILEMNRPYTGLMQVSLDPVRDVLGRMGQ